MKLQQITEARYDAPPIDIKKLERLLNAVARVVPFIGWEATSSEKIKDELEQAFEEAVGMSWADWTDR